MATLKSDLVASHPEASHWSRARVVLAFMRDPSLRAVLTFRLASRSRGRTVLLWRIWTISRYRSEIFKCELGPGLSLPYPFGIVIADGVTVGQGVVLYNCVTLGTARAPAPGEMLPVPKLGDRVTIGPGTVVAGPVTVGAGATIGAHAVISRNVPAMAIVEGG